MTTGKYVPQPGTTNVFRNERKTSEGAPDYTTNDLELPNVDGRWQVSIWGPKRARNGNEFFTIKIKPAYQRPSQHPDSRPAPAPANQGYASSNTYVGGDDDDAPF